MFYTLGEIEDYINKSNNFPESINWFGNNFTLEKIEGNTGFYKSGKRKFFNVELKAGA